MPQNPTHIGKYRIEGELGRGGMGVVYKAFDPVVERTVAIKTLRLDVGGSEDLIHRLRREAKSIGQLEHPNIVTLYDAGDAEGLFYLAMQFIQGETLQDRIARQECFSLDEIHDLFRQICAGLGYAHDHGVVHRDIKPANIMITSQGVVKLTDFGVAKVLGGGGATTGFIVGTPSYMSPEQAKGLPLDGRSDIFSLGSILYELTTGQRAFPGKHYTTVTYKIVYEEPAPMASLRPGLDPELEAIVLKGLAKRPEERFQTCNELSTALEVYLKKTAASAGETTAISATAVQPLLPAIPTPAPPTPTPPPPPTVSAPTRDVTSTVHKRVPLVWLVEGGLGILLLGSAILLTIQFRHPATGGVAKPQPGVTNPQAAPAPPLATQSEGQPAASPTSQAASSTPPGSEAEQAAGQAGSSGPASASAQAPNAQPESTSVGPAAVKPPGQAAHPAPPPRTARTTTQRAVTPPQPEDFDSLIVKGDVAFQQSRYTDALAAYSEAYKLRPTSRGVRTKIVTVLTLLGRAEQAQRYR